MQEILSQAYIANSVMARSTQPVILIKYKYVHFGVEGISFYALHIS